MPAGVSWPKYLGTFALAIISGFAGSQMVHQYYQPLADLEELTLKELERLKKEKGLV